MAIREFTDSKGVSWRVWTTEPGAPNLVSADYRDGWLSFDSATERRRLAPIPKGWEDLSAERLELLCRTATRGRPTDPRGGRTHTDARKDSSS
jgi:hypothetical protein